MYRSKDRLIDMLVYRIRVLISPTIEDFRAFRLPGNLAFLLYGLRPLRLAGASVKRRVF